MQSNCVGPLENGARTGLVCRPSSNHDWFETFFVLDGSVKIFRMPISIRQNQRLRVICLGFQFFGDFSVCRASALSLPCGPRFFKLGHAHHGAAAHLDSVLATRRSGFESASTSLAPRGTSGEGWERGGWRAASRTIGKRTRPYTRGVFKSPPLPGPLLHFLWRRGGPIIALGSFGRGRCQDAPWRPEIFPAF